MKVEFTICQNRSIGHAWLKVDIDYVPNTSFPYDDLVNIRCGRCGVLKAVLFSLTSGTHTTRYKPSSYPDGYRYTTDDRPTQTELIAMLVQRSREVARAQRRRLRAVS